MVHFAVGQRGRHGVGRRRGAGQRHHLLNGQPQLEPVQRVADPDLTLDLGVCARWVHTGLATNNSVSGPAARKTAKT